MTKAGNLCVFVCVCDCVCGCDCDCVCDMLMLILGTFCFHVYAQKWVFVIMSHVTFRISHVTCHMSHVIWRGVRSGLNMTATRGKNSDGHKNDGIQYSDGSTCCHTSYWHDALACLTFRHPTLKLFQLMPRFLGYFGRFSLPLFWVTFCILWICDKNTLNILVPGVSICRNLYEQSKHVPFTYPAKI